MKSERYIKKLMPTKELIEKSFEDYPELEKLLKGLKCNDGGFYVLNDNEMFDCHSLPEFCKFEIVLDTQKGVSIKSIHEELSETYCKKSKPSINWSKKPNNVYGRDKIAKNKEVRDRFNRGHLFADSIIKYSKKFGYFKRKNFVMITEWCNRANNAEACGMYYFEEIILKSVEAKIKISYRVTPVFKKIELCEEVSDGQMFEYIPRGIIIEAKTRDGKSFKCSKVKNHKDIRFTDEFNVFIPNAQKNLKINYKTGEVEEISE